MWEWVVTYSLIVWFQIHENATLWNRLWEGFGWPKISNFLWLVAWGHSLTWDLVWRKCYEGPYLCILCSQAEESTETIFITCPFASMRAFFQQIFKCTLPSLVNVKIWIAQCFYRRFKNYVFLRAWHLVLGFTLWTLWKEKNLRIFEMKKRTMPLLKEVILHNIREKFLVSPPALEDCKVNEYLNHILKILNINSNMFVTSHSTI